MYVFNCFLVVFMFWIGTTYSMNSELSLNIKHIISTNIRTKYSLRDQLTHAELKWFIETVVQSSESGENSDNGSEYLMACDSPWNSTDDLTHCKEALSRKCLEPTTLLRLYSYPEYGLAVTDTFPALVYYLQNVTCQERRNENKNDAVHSAEEGLVWAYGIGFSILNCFISMVGGLLVPFMKRHIFQRILLYCVGLGVGTLASAGCLVLLPESLELFGTEYFKMAVLLAGLYLCYLSGRIKFQRKLARKSKEEAIQRQVHVIATDETLRIIQDVPQPEQEICDLPDHIPADDEVNQQTGQEVSTFAWMLLFGDAFHKFIDGVSVGASFTESTFTGFSVAVAIVFEELPHELGDIAFLLRAGMSVKRALLYNLIAVVPSFIGVSLGIVLGENTHATTWILAVAGGMFIYISCVDMMPEMEQQAKEAIEKKNEKPGIVFLLQNLGLLTGFLIIFLLMLFGTDIEKSLITPT